MHPIFSRCPSTRGRLGIVRRVRIFIRAQISAHERLPARLNSKSDDQEMFVVEVVGGEYLGLTGFLLEKMRPGAWLAPIECFGTLPELAIR